MNRRSFLCRPLALLPLRGREIRGSDLVTIATASRVVLLHASADSDPARWFVSDKGESVWVIWQDGDFTGATRAPLTNWRCP